MSMENNIWKNTSGTSAAQALDWLQAHIHICLPPIIIQWIEPSPTLHFNIFSLLRHNTDFF